MSKPLGIHANGPAEIQLDREHRRPLKNGTVLLTHHLNVVASLNNSFLLTEVKKRCGVRGASLLNLCSLLKTRQLDWLSA